MRFAVESDRKERGAAQKSRFYLFNPDWDPETEEGRRRREGRDKRYREREGRDSYRRRGGGRFDDRYDDRGEEKPEEFDVNLYDDDPNALSKRANLSPRPGSRNGRVFADSRRRHSRSRSPSDRSSEHDRYRSANRDKELFPNSRPRDALRSARGSHARNRSASPAKDDRDAMEDDLAKDREAVRNNRDKARSIKERIYNTNSKIESAGRELFPAAVELFPSKNASGSGKAQMDQINEGMRGLSYDGAFDSDASTPVSSSPHTPTSVESANWRLLPESLTRYNIDYGRLNGSVRGGSSRPSPHSMLTIKGTAKSVRELFPSKFQDDVSIKTNNNSNTGRELFADKLDGRGHNRRRAGDLFD